MKRLALVLVALVATIGGATAAIGASLGGSSPGLLSRLLPGTVSRLLADFPRLGPLLNTQRLTVTLPLVLPDRAALNRYEAAEYVRGNPDYHHFLSPAQFGRLYGAPSGEVGQAVAALKQLGLTVSTPDVNHLYLKATASVGTLEQIFSTTLERFKITGHALLGGQEFFANTSNIRLPASLDGLVSNVIGLDDTAILKPAYQRAAATAKPALLSPTGKDGGATPCLAADAGAGYTAPDLATAYDFNGLYAKGLHGEGMSAALVEYDDYHDSNVATMESCYGITTPVTRRLVDGGVGGTPGSGETEAMLDISVLLEMLPKLSHLYVYEAPISGLGSVRNDGGAELDLYNAFVTDDLAPVLSASWGNCEQTQSQGYSDLMGVIAEEAVVQGQQIFDASGDSGAVDCSFYPPPVAGSISVEQEAAIPWITGVGGTDLSEASTLAGTTIHQELPWNDAGAGGGGQSAVFTMPSWQESYLRAAHVTPPGEANDCGAPAGTFCRMVPDISLNADPAAGGALDALYGGSGPTPPQFAPGVGSPGYSIYCATANCQLLPVVLPGPLTGGLLGWQPVGGTSAATPLLAAAAVLWDQEGKQKGLGSTLGFLNPSFYAIASNATRYAADFHDITSGSNDDQYSDTCPPGCNPNHLYAAAPGYDMATGLGSIDAARLGDDLVAAAETVDVTPSTAQMYGYVHGPTTTQAVSVTGGAHGATYTASSSASWLQVNSAGALPGHLSWHVDPAALKAGHYTGHITIADRNGTKAKLTVDYTVTARATLAVSPASITFSETAIDSNGKATSPVCGASTWNDELTGDSSTVAPSSLATLSIRNTGASGSVLHWEAFLVTPTSAWLTTDLNPASNPNGFQNGPTQPLVPTAGSVAAGATGQLKLASIANENALGGYPRMNQGTYSGLVQVRDLADNSVIATVPVKLVLGSGQGTPTIATNPGSISVTLAPGASSTTNLVLSDGSGQCGYSYSLGTPASWVGINPFLASGVVGPQAATAAPAASDTGSGDGYTPITINAAGLAPGTYKTNLTINSQDAVTNPTNVPITLTIPGAKPQPKPKPCTAKRATLVFVQHVKKPVRETSAVVSINGKVVKRIHGHAIARVTVAHPKASAFTLTLVATLSDGEVVARTVKYNGCHVGKPVVKVLHRAR